MQEVRGSTPRISTNIMIFSKRAIKTAIKDGKLVIVPFDEANIGSAHIDLHLGALPGKALVLKPKEFVTAQTKERITLSRNICGFVEGRASLAMKGISIEQSSTFIEPGSDDTMTLEIFNASDKDYELEPGQPIAKMCLTKVIDDI